VPLSKQNQQLRPSWPALNENLVALLIEKVMCLVSCSRLERSRTREDPSN
jgi:hypothetical protein